MARRRALYFHVEPLDSPPGAAGTYLVVWPEEGGDGRYCHNAHPDRTVATAMAGDVLVHRSGRYRVIGVQRLGDWDAEWVKRATDCMAAL